MSEGTRRGIARRRERTRVQPRDLDRLQREGEISEALRPLVDIAGDEARELFDALGGFDVVSPQRRLLIEDAVATGIVLRGVLALYLRTEDVELVSKVGTLTAARRASLIALGLDRAEHLVPDLATYLAAKDAQAPPSGTNGDATDAEVMESENATDSATDSHVVAPEARDNGGGVGLVDRAPPPHAAANDQPEPPGSIDRRST